MFSIFNPELMRQQKLERIRTENELRCIEIDRKLHKRMFESFIRRKYYDRFKKLQIYEQHQQNLMNEKKQIKCYQSYGFHFRRNGKGRQYFVRGGRNNAHTGITNSRKELNDAQKYEENLTFHCIEDLLFTDDEIDIDKIITLHLFSVQDNLSLITSDLTFSNGNGTLRRASTKNLSTRRTKYLSLNTDRSKIIIEKGGYVTPRAGETSKSTRCDTIKGSSTLPIDQLLLLSSDQDIKKKVQLGNGGELWVNNYGDDNDDLTSSRRSTGVTSTMMRGKIKHVKHLNSSRSNSIQEIYQETKALNSQSDTKKLIINIKLIKLLNSVVASLQHSNPSKIAEILNRLHSKSHLKQMLKTQKITYFLRLLDTKQFMMRPESYYVIDNIKNPVVYLQIDQYPSLEKLIYDTKESSGSGTIHKSDSIKGSNWKLNISASQLSPQNKSSNKMIDQNESLNLLTGNDSRVGTSGASIAEYLSKRLRANLQIHENEMRKLKQLKETVSDEVLFNEKYFKSQQLPPPIAQNSYSLDAESVTQDSYYDELMNRDVQIVAKPFTIRQSYCYACLNKFRRPSVVPKIPTLMASRPSNWFEAPRFNSNYYNCPGDVLFLNNNISYQSTDAINRILTTYINDSENKNYELFGKEPLITTLVKEVEDPPPIKPILPSGKLAGGGSPTIDTSSVADDGVYFFPTQSVYSDQTFFRNSAWPLKLLNDNELYTMVFKDVNLRKLEERITKIEIQKRLNKFLNS